LLPQVGVGVVVFDERGRILLVRRGGSPGKGLWSLPGGKLEPGERIFEAAARELKEEVGIDAEPVAVLDVNELIVRRPGGELAYHYVLVCVLAKPRSLDVKPGSDALDAKFFELGEALAEKELSPSTRKFLEKLSKGEVCRASPATVELVEG